MGTQNGKNIYDEEHEVHEGEKRIDALLNFLRAFRDLRGESSLVPACPGQAWILTALCGRD
jgi:hypothetical protein